MTPSGRVLARSEHRGVEIAATREAIWWRMDGQTWQRLGWWEIEQAFWRAEDEQLRVVPVTGEAVLLPVGDTSRLPEVVRERVMSSILATVPIDVGQGAQVTFRQSPSGVIAQVKWGAQQSGEETSLAAALNRAVREAAGNLGIDL